MNPEPTTSIETAALPYQQHAIIRLMGFGYSFEEACQRIDVRVDRASAWMVEAPHFGDMVERERLRQELEAIEEIGIYKAMEQNMYQQALEPTTQAANLSLRILERRVPHKWAKPRDQVPLAPEPVKEVIEVVDYLAQALEQKPIEGENQ